MCAQYNESSSATPNNGKLPVYCGDPQPNFCAAAAFGGYLYDYNFTTTYDSSNGGVVGEQTSAQTCEAAYEASSPAGIVGIIAAETTSFSALDGGTYTKYGNTGFNSGSGSFTATISYTVPSGGAEVLYAAATGNGYLDSFSPGSIGIKGGECTYDSLVNTTSFPAGSGQDSYGAGGGILLANCTILSPGTYSFTTSYTGTNVYWAQAAYVYKIT